MRSHYYPLRTWLLVAPDGGKYGVWVCPCGRAAHWNLDTGSGWCDCGLTLNTTGAARPLFEAATDGPTWFRAHVDSLPTVEGTL